MRRARGRVVASLRTSLLALLLAGSLLPLAGLAALEYGTLVREEQARALAEHEGAALAGALRAAAAPEDPLGAAGSTGEEALLLARDGSYQGAQGGGAWPALAQAAGERVSGTARLAHPDGRDVVAAWARVPGSDALVVVVRAPAAPGLVSHLPFLLLATFTLAGVALVVGFVAARVLAPVARLERASERLARGEWHDRVPLEGPTEVRALAASFNAMSQTLLEQRARLDALLEDRTRALIDREGDLDALRFTLAHEFREPLRSLRWMTDDLLDEPLDPRAREAALVLARRIDDLDAVFRDLLRYEDVSRRPAPIEELALDEVLAEAERAAERAGPLLVDAEALPRVRGNHALLVLAFAELLRNAAQHARPPRGPARVRVRGRVEDEHALVQLDDAGPGIPPARREDVLQLFQRLRRDVPGTGAGLALARRVLERHEGSLRVLDAPGGGTRVELRLPLAGPTERAPLPGQRAGRRF